MRLFIIGKCIISLFFLLQTMSEELMLRRQDTRNDTLNRFCQKHTIAKDKSVPSRRHLDNLVVVDQDEIIYCAIPKVASTEWREALTVYVGHDKVKGKESQNRTMWKHLNEYSTQNVTDKLQKYYKFIFVREPFARLLSAYKSKFVAGNDYYFKTFGREIIQKFRKNATEHAKNTGDDVTFLEFLKHIIVAQYHDEHWRPYDDLCHVCSINYDFIGHLETIDEDTPFLLKELGVEDRVTFKSRRRSPQSSSDLLKYYSQIPGPYIKRLGKIYFRDFQMFGYPFPGPLKSLVVDST